MLTITSNSIEQSQQAGVAIMGSLLFPLISPCDSGDKIMPTGPFEEQGWRFVRSQVIEDGVYSC